MGEFTFYLWEGVRHITDPEGMDHMLYVITLCSFYNISQWKNVLYLVTAFTLGHSLTLGLSALNIIHINQQLVELLIPVTILLTSIFNVAVSNDPSKSINWNYLLALGFGLIHGMGFSNYFRSMMMGISDESILQPLLGFNLGVEFGQLIIVALYLFAFIAFAMIFKITHRDWKLYVSGAGGGLAMVMIVEQIIA